MAPTQKFKVEMGKWKGENSFAFPLSAFPFRKGITLIEVLISMFVLLFGLMGVAAIFPVASHYVLEGDKRDRSSGLAQIAFEELRSRDYLKPKEWLEANNTASGGSGLPIIAPIAPYIFLSAAQQVPHAVVIDPLGSATQVTPTSEAVRKKYFPRASTNVFQNPWRNTPPYKDLTVQSSTGTAQVVTDWPIKRVTFDMHPDPFQTPTMSGPTAETAFRLRDDLITQQPDAGDRPSVQRWRRNGTQLLAREFSGDYSWLATVVPTRQTALLGLQPSANYKDEFYEVTSVVFYKRDTVPSATVGSSAGSERLVSAEFLNNGELALYNDASTVDTVDTALDGIKPTNWIAVCGVNQITGAFMLKWYKILAMDDSSSPDTLPGAGSRTVRYLMVDGPEWPEVKNSSGVSLGWQNLRAIILPGAIDAYTQVMQLTNSARSGDLVPTGSQL